MKKRTIYYLYLATYQPSSICQLTFGGWRWPDEYTNMVVIIAVRNNVQDIINAVNTPK